MVKCISIPRHILQTCTGIGIAKGKFGIRITAASIVAAAINAMRTTYGIPCGFPVIGNIVIIEGYIVVVFRSCRIRHQPDHRVIFNQNRLLLANFRIIRIIGQIQFCWIVNRFVNLPIIPIRTCFVSSFFQNPYFLRLIIAISTEDIHIGQARSVKVIIFIRRIKLQKLLFGLYFPFTITNIFKIQFHCTWISSIFRQISTLIITAVIRIDNRQISPSVSFRHFQIRIILHRKMRIRSIPRRHHQHPVRTVYLYVKPRSLLGICSDHQSPQFIQLVPASLEGSQLDASCRRGSVLNSNRGGLSCGGQHRLLGRDLGGDGTVGYIQRLALVVELQLQGG